MHRCAIDAIAAAIMGFDPLSIPYLRMCQERGLGVADPRDIEIVGDPEAGALRMGFTTSRSLVIWGDQDRIIPIEHGYAVRDARPGWRRAVKGAVVPAVVGAAAEVLVVGTLARESMLARGVDADRISVVANTVDVARFGHEADELAQCGEPPVVRLITASVWCLSISRIGAK